MSHYAKIEDNIVTNVIVAEADHVATLDGTWVKTSYNMHGGIYYDPATNKAAADQSIINGDEARERKNYAGAGYHYDGTGFFTPKPYESWNFNSTTYLWDPPPPRPDPDEGKGYTWNENTKAWEKQ